MDDNSILGMMIAAAPGIGAVLWLMFKAYAKRSPATWDDEVVAFVEAVAKDAAKREVAEQAARKPDDDA